MAKILLIDDDQSLHVLLGKYLEQKGYILEHAYNGKEGLRALFARQFDMVILDVMMPEMNGWTVLERIREVSELPVILLTARDAKVDKLKGFRLGTDDYITKPFSFDLLLARIQAIFRRTGKQGNDLQPVIQVGDLELDVMNHIVKVRGLPVELTPTEFRLLEVMMKQPGRVFTKEQLVRRVWGDEYISETGYIRNYIWHLRSKLEADRDNPQYIHTVKGGGYKVEAI